MKVPVLSAASFALLGLPVALAALLPTQQLQDAQPTRPDPALRISPASPEPTANRAVVEENKQEVPGAENNFEQQREEEEQQQRHWWHDLLRRAAVVTSPPVHNTFTHLNTSTITSAPATAGTEVAVFTAEGLAFTVTEISGKVAVDGKSLVPGGPAQLIAGEYISEGSSGVVVVDGSTLQFAPYSSSSQAPTQPVGSSSSAAAGSSAGGASASSSSSGDAALQTANIVAVVGAVIGAIVL